MAIVTVDVLLKLHQVAILIYGGTDGILNEGTLYYLTEKTSHCSDPIIKATFLLHGIATMHPFFDGIKRTALMAANTVLGLHGLMITASNEVTVSFVLSVARGEKTENQVGIWIGKNSDMYRSY